MPEYNILQKAGSLLGFKHSEETRAKMSSSKEGLKHPNFGKTTSQEVKDKIIKSKGIAVSVLDLQTNETIIYPSGNQAAKAISCSSSVFQNYLKSGKILKNRYILSKVVSK